MYTVKTAKTAYLSNSSPLRSGLHIYARISKDQLPCCSVTAGGTTKGDGPAMVRQLHITYSTLWNHRVLRVTWNWFSNCCLFSPLHSLWNMITWSAITACPAQTKYVDNRMEVRTECNIKKNCQLQYFGGANCKVDIHPQYMRTIVYFLECI